MLIQQIKLYPTVCKNQKILELTPLEDELSGIYRRFKAQNTEYLH